MRRLISLGILFCAIWLSGCSSLSVQSETIHQVLSTDVALRVAVERCRNFDLSTRQKVEFERSVWWQKNSQWVLAADQSLVDLNWQKTDEFQEANRAVAMLQLLALTHTDAEQRADEWLGNDANAEQCQRFFNRVAQGHHDLKLSAKQQTAISRTTVNSGDIKQDALDARSVNARYRKYGRSLYLAEKAIQQQGCSDPSMALIRNAWPLEIYDAQCNQNNYFLVKCEWGRCSVKQ